MPSEFIQNFENGEIDVLSFSAWATADADALIDRRLEDPVESWNHYIAYLKGIKAVFTQTSGIVIVDGVEVTSIQQLIDDALVTIANSGGRLGYKTYAEMTNAAALPAGDPLKLPANVVVEVTNDTEANNGAYVYDGSTFTKAPDTGFDDSNLVGISQTEDNVWEAKDKDGKISAKVTKDGASVLARLESDSIIYEGQELSIRLDNLASEQIAVSNTTLGNNYPANINHFEIYGQSLSQGALSTPIQTTTQKYDSLMYVGGVRPQHPSYSVANFYADFIPLVEASAIDGYPGHETPVSGATEAVKQLILDENGVAFTDHEYRLLGSASGTGGETIAQLSTFYFDNHLKPTITNAYNLAQSKGLTYAMPYVGWVQGENDNKKTGISITAYKDAMQALIAKIDAHLKTLHSSLEMKGLITTQLASFTTTERPTPHIELAIYEAATVSNSNIFLACPLYIFDYADKFHVDGVSSKWMGAYIGLAYKRLVVDQVGWEHIHPLSHVKQGRILEVKYHVPVQPLQVDTTQVALNTNYGFTIVDSAGVNIPIESVKVTQGDTIRFITASPLPEGAELRYAYTPNTSTATGGLGRLTGARGNIRDSQGDDIIFDPTGINKPLHNWTPIHYYKV